MNVSAFPTKLFLHRVVRYCFFSFVCCFTLAFAPSVSLADGVQSARDDLQEVFGTPETFAQEFEENVKQKSDSVVGLLTAAAGFGYVFKVFL
jgi:hypothetical protein